MTIEYTIKGITLNAHEIAEIHHYHEVICTAQYLMCDYDITDEDEAIKLAKEVRSRMNNYGESETNAIYEVMKGVHK